MSDTGASAESGNRPARYPRSAPALIGALLAVLALIAAIWALSRFQHREIPDPAAPVDYTAELAEARESAPFAVLAPRSTPAGWRATSVFYDSQGPDVAWHLGFLTPRGEYVGLEQSNAASAGFVATSTRATQSGDPVAISGREWQTLSSSDGREHALVRRDGEVTTVVTGTAAWPELEAFAASLTER